MTKVKESLRTDTCRTQESSFKLLRSLHISVKDLRKSRLFSADYLHWE